MLSSGAVKADVLVIEDSPEVQRYLRTLLELDSYHAETASNGEEALQRLRDGYNPSLAVLDMQMPGMDGLETLRRLRELRPELKVIMCSGVDDPEKIRQAVALGAQAYILKPVQHLYLSAALDRCLDQIPARPKQEPVRGRVICLTPSDPFRAN